MTAVVRTQRILEGLLGRVDVGGLELRGADGAVQTFGDPEHPLQARIDIHDERAFARIVHGGSVGLGDSYVRGQWSSPDVVSLIRLLIANRTSLRRLTPVSLLNIAADRVLHLFKGNRPARARKNIIAHYDLSNELYATFLDRSMTYSCARFGHVGQSLDDAQREKLVGLAERARLRPGLEILEIGCGWGAFSVMAAKEYGCRVTAVTLSDAQAEYVRELIVREGVEDRVEVRIQDYRHVEGSFDRIVSIEMLEAVGHRYLPTYFATLDRLLRHDGVAVIQVITIPDQRERSYRRRPDFIQRAIFPGGHLPSLTTMTRAMTRRSRLMIEELENIGPHYAETLRNWRERFLASTDRVQQLGFDATFMRLWEFYLAYCEGAFLSRYLNDLQLVLTRTANGTLGTWPYSGAHAPLSERDHLLFPRPVAQL
jgi:cyclopropane-fatty-acyl-phospholipid synthase